MTPKHNGRKRGSSTKIKYTHKANWSRPTYMTQKYGNLMSDTVQGEVCQSDDGTWSGWFTNHSRRENTKFKLGFATKGLATRWVNALLRDFGVGKA